MTGEEKILDMLAGFSMRFDALDAKLDSVDNRLTKLEFKIETDIEPKLDALTEGHKAILDQLVPISRVDELESRVKFLESILRTVCDELQQLKKAQ